MKPIWFKQNIVATENGIRVRDNLNKLKLNTVCNEAKCPNRNFCYNRGTATFLIMGKTCTRNCKFCSVIKGIPLPLETDEPDKIADACINLDLKYVVITSVTRDDLPDGGAEYFRNTVNKINKKKNDISIEVLVPDFKGDLNSVDKVLDSPIEIFGHNLETIPQLYPKIRPKADYKTSLKILEHSAKNNIKTKTGIMVGCGESKDKIFQLIKEVYNSGVTIMTIGQYLQPSKNQIEVQRYVTPDEFDECYQFGKSLGMKIFSHPLARSSFLSDLNDNELNNYNKKLKLMHKINS